MSDFLQQKNKEINNRIAELAPLVAEYRRLEAAAAALKEVASSKPAATSTAPARRPGRPAGSKSKSKPTSKAAKGSARSRGGRPKGSGTRGGEVVSLVAGQPGITISELAGKMGIKQNYLYRLLPSLEQEGKVKKQGRGWHPR